MQGKNVDNFNHVRMTLQVFNFPENIARLIDFLIELTLFSKKTVMFE